MNRQLITVAAVGAMSAALLAGCGSSSSPSTNPGTSVSSTAGETPIQQIQTALTSLASGTDLTATFQLGLSGSSLESLVNTIGHSSLTSAQANEIAGGKIVIAEHTTASSLSSAVSTPNSNQTDVSFIDDGTTLVDVRSISGVVYIQLQLGKLFTLFNAPPGELSGIQAYASNLPTFVQKLIDGDWISIQTSDLKSLEQEITGAVGASAPASPNSSQQQAFLSNLEQILTNDVTVTQTGSTSSGTTYTLSANTRTLVVDLINAVEKIEPALSSEVNSQFKASKVPSKTITFGATVTDGKVSQISFDFAQLAPPSAHVPASDHLPLDLNLSTAPVTVSVPSGATPVNMSDLGSLLGEIGGATGSGGSSF